MTPLLWAVFTVLVAVVAVGLTIPLVRRYDAAAREGDAVTAVLRDQLAEVDTQAASGQVGAGETEALRTEIKRRLLVESRARPVPVRLLGDRAAARGAVALAAVVGLAATGLYAVLGRPDLTAPAAPATIAAEVAQAEGRPTPDATGVAALIGQLEARMAQAPGDPEGWRLLGAAYFQTQRYADAANAYAKALKLNPKNAGYVSALGEARVQAAGGVVTPAAQTAFTAAQGLDPKDFRARYFLALARDQAGDHRGAIDAWLTLLREAPPGAPWAPELRRFVRQAASDARIDLTGRLPADGPAEPVPPGSTDQATPGSADQAPPGPTNQAAPPGPTAADVANITALPPAEQQAFIRSMVASLAAKLKANPRDADGWIRLIRARQVLGDSAAARTALRNAKAAFADAPQSRAAIIAAAASAGVL